MTPKTMVVVAVLVVLAIGAAAWYVYATRSSIAGTSPKFFPKTDGASGATLGDQIIATMDKGGYGV